MYIVCEITTWRLRPCPKGVYTNTILGEWSCSSVLYPWTGSENLSNYSSTGAPNTLDVNKLVTVWLEVKCSQCTEQADTFSPCSQGHIICNTCKNICPRCNGEYTTNQDLTRNTVGKILPLQEQSSALIDGADLRRRYYALSSNVNCPEESCTKIIKDSQVLDHLKKDHHMCPMRKDPSFGRVYCELQKTKCFDGYFVIVDVSEWGTFLVREERIGGSNFICNWVSYLGSRAEANSFKYNITISRDDNGLLFYFGPVEPLYMTSDDVLKTGNHLVFNEISIRGSNVAASIVIFKETNALYNVFTKPF